MARPPRLTPIYINRWISGWVTQRNIMVSPGGRVDQRYYGGRPDTLIAGSNMEISSFGTLKRSPGFSAFTTATFPSAILSGYDWFQISDAGVTTLINLTSTAGFVYTVTPSGKTQIFAKTAGAGQTFFQGIGKFLYFGDGVSIPSKFDGTNVWKWGIATPAAMPSVVTTPSGAAAAQWQASSYFSTMGLIVDSNSNIQAILSVNATGLNTTRFGTSANGSPAWNQTPGGTTADGTGGTAFNWTNRGPIGAWAPGAVFNWSGAFGTLTNPAAIYDPASNAVFVQVNTNTLPGTSGSVRPAFVNNPGTFINDGSVRWGCIGSPGNFAWKNSHAYIGFTSTLNTNSEVIEPVQTLPGPNNQTVFLQTTANGATGGTSSASFTGPNWATGSGQVTVDNQIIWVCLGSAAWPATTAVVAWSGAQQFPFNVVKDTNGNLQVCIFGGNTASAHPTWETTYGSVTTETTGVKWVCVGSATNAVWAANTPFYLPAAGFNPPLPSDPFGGADILDPNGNVQFVIQSGISGASAPSWNLTVGGTTADNSQITWINEGVPATSSLTWSAGYTYLYSYKSRKANDVYVTTAPPGQLSPLGPPTGAQSGHVSTASPVNTLLQGTSNTTGAVNTIGGMGSADLQVDTIVIWRNLDGGTGFPELTEIANPAPIGGIAQPWSFVDTIPDSQRQGINVTAPVDDANDPPNAGAIVFEFHAARFWYCVGSSVFYMGGPDTLVGNPSEASPPANKFTYPFTVYKIKSTTQGLLVFTAGGTYIILGTISATGALAGASGVVFYDKPFIKGLAIAGYNAVTDEGSQIWAFSSSRILYQIDATGVNQAGAAIGDQLNNLNPANVYLSSHIGGSQDIALYLGDGSTTIYRLNPNMMPEGGPVWATARAVTGGVGWLQSLYTAIGTRKLLIAQGGNSTNSMAFRDLTTNADLGTPYTCSAVIGSLVLAQPGQKAPVKFIVIESTHTGGILPIVSVLPEEISGSFEQISDYSGNPNGKSVPDPPNLAPSATIDSWRHSLLAGNKPAWLRHMQVQIAFAAQNQPDEILTMTIASSLEGE